MAGSRYWFNKCLISSFSLSSLWLFDLRFLFLTLCVWCFLWLLWYLLGRKLSNVLCQGLIALLALFGWRCFHQYTVIQPVCGGRHGRINVEPLFSIFPDRGSYYMLPPFFCIQRFFVICQYFEFNVSKCSSPLSWSVFILLPKISLNLLVKSMFWSCKWACLALQLLWCLLDLCLSIIWMNSMTAWTPAHSRHLAFIKPREKSIGSSAGLMPLALWMIWSCVIVQSVDRRLSRSVLLVLDAVGHAQLSISLFVHIYSIWIIEVMPGSTAGLRTRDLQWSLICFHLNIQL